MYPNISRIISVFPKYMSWVLGVTLLALHPTCRHTINLAIVNHGAMHTQWRQFLCGHVIEFALITCTQVKLYDYMATMFKALKAVRLLSDLHTFHNTPPLSNDFNSCPLPSAHDDNDDD